jgi:ABC transport system ATP-binding/permease protein
MLRLLVSALVSTSEQTMPLMVVLVMAQLVLCGGLFDVVGRHPVAELSWLTPARWGYAAAAATVDLRSLMPRDNGDGLWQHSGGAWISACWVLLLQLIVIINATRLALHRHEPGR